jgi:hypothetical protein
VHNSAVSECERDLLLLRNNNYEINTGYGRRQASSCLAATSFFHLMLHLDPGCRDGCCGSH